MPVESKVRCDGSFKCSASANRLLAFLLIAFFVLAAGCSGSKTVSQKNAEEQISKNLKQDLAHMMVEVGRIGTACVLTLSDGEESSMDLSPAGNITLIAAQAAGFVSVTPDGNGFWKVALTDKGKAAVYRSVPDPPKKGCDYQATFFIAGTPQLVKVTGVTASQETPEAEFVWRWDLTEFGRELRVGGKIYDALTPEQRKNLHGLVATTAVDFPIPAPPENDVNGGKVSFKKYTDGWRIQ